MDEINQKLVVELKEGILRLVKERPYASFVEFSSRLAGFAGESTWVFTAKKKDKTNGVLLWSGMSSEAVQAIRELCRSKQIKAHPSNILIYLADGRLLRDFKEEGVLYKFAPLTFTSSTEEYHIYGGDAKTNKRLVKQHNHLTERITETLARVSSKDEPNGETQTAP